MGYGVRTDINVSWCRETADLLGGERAIYRTGLYF
jgi:hypothetical protein